MLNGHEKMIEDFTNNLLEVKDEYIKMKQELSVSIRLDILKIELLDILQNSNDYEELQENIRIYLDELMKGKVFNSESKGTN